MAEVSLTVELTGEELPAPYNAFTEVCVTRRLYRSGESEYSINNSTCRLRDIRELFLDTGLNPKAYAVISQGHIGSIVDAHPEDRRVLFKEAAGIAKFKERKTAALRKLDATEQNLVRLADLTAEVKRQLGSLQRQAHKAQRYHELGRQFEELELRMLLHNHGSLRERLAVLDYVAERRERDGPLSDYLARNVRERASVRLADEPFFAGPPYDLRRKPGGRPLAVVFETTDCPGCDELHQVSFKRKEVLEQVARYDVVRFALASRTEVTLPDGRAAVAQDWARELGVAYAPAIVLFDRAGREALRLEAYMRPFHVAGGPASVADDSYRSEPSFQRYLQARTEHLVMRAIGASSGTIAWLFIGEGLILGLLSWVIALPLSLPAGYAMTQALGAALQGEIVYRYTPTGALYWLGIIVVLSVIASYFPARGATRISVRESLAYV